MLVYKIFNADFHLRPALIANGREQCWTPIVTILPSAVRLFFHLLATGLIAMQHI